MTHSTLSSEFKAFKHRIIAESLTAPSNTLFGLSKQHIEVILGIPMPMLMESADKKLQKRVLHEQFIYEQFLRNVGQAIAGQVRKGTEALTHGYQAAKHAVHHALEVTLKGPADLIKFLSVVVKEPKYLQIFWLNLQNKLADVRAKISNYFVKLGESLKKEAKTDKLASAVMAGWEQLKGLFAKVDSLKGWQQAMLGLGLFVLCSYILQETGGLEALTKSLEHAVHDIGHTAHSAEVGVRGAQAAIKSGEKAGTAGAAIGAGAGGIIGTLVGGAIASKLAKLVGKAAMEAVGNMITGGIWTALKTLISIIGKFAFVATVLSPITEAVIKQYKEDKKLGLTGGESLFFAGAPQQSQVAEQRIKLADIIFTEDNRLVS